MHIQQNLVHYNIGDQVERILGDGKGPEKGMVVGYHYMKFSVSKEINALGLRKGIYNAVDGLMVKWDSRPASHEMAEDLLVVRSEFPQKPRLTKGRMEVMSWPILVENLPKLPYNIGDFVKVKGDERKRIVVDIDYVAAMEHTPTKAYTCIPFNKDTKYEPGHGLTDSNGEDIYVESDLELSVKGAFSMLLVDKLRTDYLFYNRGEYMLFHETSGVKASNHEVFAMDGIARLKLANPDIRRKNPREEVTA